MAELPDPYEELRHDLAECRSINNAQWVDVLVRQGANGISIASGAALACCVATNKIQAEVAALIHTPTLMLAVMAREASDWTPENVQLRLKALRSKIRSFVMRMSALKDRERVQELGIDMGELMMLTLEPDQDQGETAKEYMSPIRRTVQTAKNLFNLARGQRPVAETR